MLSARHRYDVSIGLELDRRHLAAFTWRSTVLRNELTPETAAALLFGGRDFLFAGSSAVISNVALGPLKAIARNLARERGRSATGRRDQRPRRGGMVSLKIAHSGGRFAIPTRFFPR